MCGGLAGIQEAMEQYASRFDPAVLSGEDVGLAVTRAAAIENMAATVKALAASWVADTGGWRKAGDRSPAHHLARTTGTSVGQAVEVIETARRLETLPEVAAEARRGRLSTGQASLISSAAAADPDAQGELLARAAKSSYAELREECARVRSTAEPDPEARRARIHRQRFLRSYTDTEGGWHLRVRNNPEVGALFMAALAPFTDRFFRRARVEGRIEPVEAYAADALSEMAEVATEAGAGAGAVEATEVTKRTTPGEPGHGASDQDGTAEAGAGVGVARIEARPAPSGRGAIPSSPPAEADPPRTPSSRPAVTAAAKRRHPPTVTAAPSRREPEPARPGPAADGAGPTSRSSSGSTSMRCSAVTRPRARRASWSATGPSRCRPSAT